MSQESEKIAHLSEALHRSEEARKKERASNEAMARENARLREALHQVIEGGPQAIAMAGAKVRIAELENAASEMEQRAIAAERERDALQANLDSLTKVREERDAIQAKLDKITRVPDGDVTDTSMRLYGGYSFGYTENSSSHPTARKACRDLEAHIQELVSALRATRVELDQARAELEQARAELERLRGDRECFGKLLAAERCAVDLSAKLAQAMNVVAAAKRWYSHGNDKELMASVKEYNASQPTPSEPKRFENGTPHNFTISASPSGATMMSCPADPGARKMPMTVTGSRIEPAQCIVESPEPNGEVGT